jgi:hypothetical protein
MIQVRYIGRKPIKTDNVAHSGAVWVGPGDVQPVTPEVWAQLRPFDAVWEQVEGEPVAAVGLEQAPVGEAIVDAWLTKTPAELHAYAEERGIKLDKRLKDADKIRAAIDAATAG